MAKVRFKRGDIVRWIARDLICTVVQVRTNWLSCGYKIEYRDGNERYRVWVQAAQVKDVFE